MEPSTGLRGLDSVLKGLMPGDNVVWEVESIDDYLPFVEPFYQQSGARDRPCIYFRFARHRQLIPEDAGVEIIHLDPEQGFETFISTIHKVIDRCGYGGYFIFDCLSDLAGDWNSDRMVGNFFRLTCPYLYDRDTITYFALTRNMHSFRALQPITETTQLFLHVYRHKSRLYVHPTKVLHRYSPTMYTMHEWQGPDKEFRTVLESTTNAEIMTSFNWSTLDPARTQLSLWDRAFMQAETLLEDELQGRASRDHYHSTVEHLLRMMFSRDERVLALARKSITLADLLHVRSRMVGTGIIGGKAAGVLLARSMLRQADPLWRERLEEHDSFFIGSDVFYTFLVENGCWAVREKQRNPATFMDGAADARHRILTGSFHDYIQRQFMHLLNYYGQSPIIVRSSSLLEDNFGNAFAGKYASVFCANQGSIERRLEDFMAAIRTIYASTMSEEALRYRERRGLLQQDEQMALLVQRVSGSLYDHYYFPQIAGVGLSFNPYVWSEQIDPAAGVLRLVFGLGTRAVDRYDDDYTRIVALNAPERRPEHSEEEIQEHTQRKVDVIDWMSNRQITVDLNEILPHASLMPMELYAPQAGDPTQPRWLTFERLLTQTEFVPAMRTMLATLQEAYNYPLEIEFACNFSDDQNFKINLLQCRPLQLRDGGAIGAPPAMKSSDQLLFEAKGAVIGQSRLCTIDRIIYVDPEIYGLLPQSDRYGVARRVGKLAAMNVRNEKTILMLGPGRWGTTQPQLGISVSFSEINRVSILGEIVAMHTNLSPDVSLGTHFFNELVESEILYLAIFPEREGNLLNHAALRAAPNRLTQLLEDAERWTEMIHVIDASDLPDQPAIKLYANSLTQSVLCYLDQPEPGGPGSGE